ncbi:hypothetical protein [Paenibacillus medicaginis]|uniref:Uncharacterized protein n=1 Tax=Paenibacillus medicaginis TaxID=1470560 RepID=A0ABV5BUJ3_9BACL
MNLYEIKIEHYAPKDSQQGILTYLVANSDEDVYEWLKSDPKLDRDRWVYTPYKDNEDDENTYDIYGENYEVIGEESYKERMIRLRGEMNDESVELSDLYYGKTLYGWNLVKEDIKEEEIGSVKRLGISIHTC